MERELKLIMRQWFAYALAATVLGCPWHARADDAPAAATASAPVAESKTVESARSATGSPVKKPSSQLTPVAIAAKRAHARLDLKLSPNSLSRVLDESGVEPMAETDNAVDTVEVTARRIQPEPIPQGIPSLLYGIMHPSEAWRIFAPIQP